MEMVEREVEGEPPLTRSLTFRKEHPGEMVCWFNLKTYKVYKSETLELSIARKGCWPVVGLKRSNLQIRKSKRSNRVVLQLVL